MGLVIVTVFLRAQFIIGGLATRFIPMAFNQALRLLRNFSFSFHGMHSMQSVHVKLLIQLVQVRLYDLAQIGVN